MSMSTSPVPPAAPPTQPLYAQLLPPRSGWPGVIGTIAIVIGALGIIGGLWGLLGPLMTSKMAQFVPPEQRTGLDVAQRWQAWTYVLSTFATLLAVLLLVAGIRLVRRRASAPGTCRAWAVLKMLLVVLQAIMTALIQRDTFAAMEKMGSLSPTGLSASSYISIAASASAVAVIVWGWALPVFLLIWLARSKIREEMATWGTPANLPPTSFA
jgi:hypothetical protein